MIPFKLFLAEREGSLAEGEAPYIYPSNTLRTSTLLLYLYVVRFLTCNSFVIHFAMLRLSECHTNLLADGRA